MILFRFFILSFFAANILLAQPLTLQEAIKQTLLTHPDAKVALYQIEEANAEKELSKADLRPNLTLNGEYFPQRTIATPANGVFFTRDIATTHVDATLLYTLWDFGKSKNRLNAALYSKDSSEFASKNTRRLLIERVWQAFYLSAYYDRFVIAYRQTAAFYEALYNQAKELRKSGLKTEADEERFFASLLEAKDALTNTENESKKALTNLALLTGLAPESIQIVDDFENSLTLKIDAKSDNEWRNELKANNKELQLLNSKIKQAESSYEAYKSEDYGSVIAIASTARDSSLSYYSSSQIGVRASIPLYSGGKISAGKEKARVAILSAKEELRSKELLLWQELYAAITDAKIIDGSIRAKNAIMESATKTVEIVSGRYKEGLASYVDVLEAKAAYENAQNGKSTAMFKKITTIAKIKRLISKEDDANEATK